VQQLQTFQFDETIEALLAIRQTHTFSSGILKDATLRLPCVATTNNPLLTQSLPPMERERDPKEKAPDPSKNERK